jgi:hypothetical protein
MKRNGRSGWYEGSGFRGSPTLRIGLQAGTKKIEAVITARMRRTIEMRMKRRIAP